MLILFFQVLIYNLLNHPLGPYAGYDKEDHNISPTKPHGTTVPPAVAVGLGNTSTPESTKETGNSSHGSAAWPLFCSHTSLTYFRFLIILFLLL